MASKFKLDIPATEPVKFDYRGLVFWLKPEPNLAEWNKVRTEQMTAYGLDDADISSMSETDQARWHGKAAATVFIDSIDPFEIDNGDGTVSQFRYDAPSDMDAYETQAQELIGENVTMQNDVFSYVVKISRIKPDYEVRALGKSSAPADSGALQAADHYNL